MNVDRTQDAHIASMTVMSNKIYVAMNQWNNISSKWDFKFMLYNGNDSAPAWTVLGGNSSGLLANIRAAPFLYSFNSKIYAMTPHNEQVRVVEYNGNDSNPAWSLADGGANDRGINKNLSKATGTMELGYHNSKVYAIWMEQSPGEIWTHTAVKIK